VLGTKYYRTPVGNHTQVIEWYHLGTSDQGFQGQGIFWVWFLKLNISKTCLVTWLTSKCVARVCQHWQSLLHLTHSNNYVHVHTLMW